MFSLHTHRSAAYAIGLGVSLSLGIVQSTSAGPASSVHTRDLDCVIEPFMTVKLASPVVGVISTLEVDRGDRVSKGQIVAHLEDAVERANVALARARATGDAPLKSAQARLAFLKGKSGRAEQLIGKNIVSFATLEEVQADVKVAQQQVAEAELNLQVAQLELKRTEALLEQRVIRSPIDGIVTERLLSPGEYRNEQSPILTLAQVTPLRVEVFVPTGYFGQVRPGTQALVTPEDPIGGTYQARVTVSDHVLDAASGTFGVRLELPNPEGALPGGLRCRLRFLDPNAREASTDDGSHAVGDRAAAPAIPRG